MSYRQDPYMRATDKGKAALRFPPGLASRLSRIGEEVQHFASDSVRSRKGAQEKSKAGATTAYFERRVLTNRVNAKITLQSGNKTGKTAFPSSWLCHADEDLPVDSTSAVSVNARQNLTAQTVQIPLIPGKAVLSPFDRRGMHIADGFVRNA